jgi:N-acetylglutamate synthase-like GNAT family acetyltransferase
MPKLKMVNVSKEEFDKELRTLDEKGLWPLRIATADKYNLFSENGKIIGYAMFSQDRLTALVVHQDFRDNGYGKMMIEQLKEIARNDNKNLVVDSPIFSYNFFKKCGVEIDPDDEGL